MLKTLDIVLIAVMISAAAWTYKIKHEAKLIDAELFRVEKKIALEKETISLLQADWSLLDQPGRLQTLVDAFQDQLKLQPMSPEQIVTANELPRRSIGIVPVPTEALGGYADNSKTVIR